MSNKFDDKHIRKVNLIQLNIDDIRELMEAKYEVELEDMKHCSNCGHIFNVNEIWYEDNHNCPFCNSVENIYDCYQDDIDEINVNDLQEDIGDDGIKEIIKILKKEEGVNIMNKDKINLQEATVKALYDGLKDNTEIDDVEGLVDDVLVVTDPEITTDEYNEVIERAGEIIEDTPEGEIPLDPTYLGEYLQICPICGGSFIEDHILEPGTACPICYETPESFVMVGKLQAEEEVAEDNGLVDEEANGEEFTPTPIDEFGAEETGEETEGEETVEPETEPEGELPNEEPVEREERPRGARTRRNREVASKEIPQGNILTENTRLTEGLRDVDRENDKWYLNMGMKTSLSDMSDMEIKHYATWQEYVEIRDIIDTDEDLDTKIQKLNELKNSIDYKIKFAVDYASTSQEAIDKWLKYYKDKIDGYINALKNGDKYYIEISGRYNVDYDGEPDDEPFAIRIKVENGKFEEGIKYYNTEEEAKSDLHTLSNNDIKDYLKKIYGDRLWEWSVEVVKASMDMMINTSLNEDNDKIKELADKLEESKEDKPVKVLCYRQVTEYPTRQEAIDEFRSGMMCSEGSERERYTNIYLSLINTDKDFVYDDVDDYNDYIVKHSKKEGVDSDKKDDGKELLLGAEEDDKEYTIEEVGEDKIRELENKSAFTWEGAVTTDEALQKIVDDFKDKTPIKLPVHFYTWSGKLFNEIYGLTDSNAYPNDLHFLSVDLDNWSEMGNLPMFKMKVGARWLDDIVDNNEVRQNEINNKK